VKEERDVRSGMTLRSIRKDEVVRAIIQGLAKLTIINA
jgi:hypothetical protein